MRTLRIKDILDLVVSDVPEPESIIEKIYEWHFEREKTICQWILGAAATVFVAVMVAFFDPNSKTPAWQFGIIVFAALATGTYGVYRIWKLRLLHRQFVAALKLFSGFEKIKPFLSQYRGRSGRQL